MIGPRTRSRELALQALFAQDVHKDGDRATYESTLAHAEVSAEVADFARQLVEGVLERTAEWDAMISSAADNWDLSRLATVDRNILRLAVYEMIARDDVPNKVAINEAIELGKRFSTKQSGAFVNGILDRIRKDQQLPAGEDDDEASGEGESDSGVEREGEARADTDDAPTDGVEG